MGQALGHNRPEEPVRHHRIRQARSAGDSSLLRQFYRSTCGICCTPQRELRPSVPRGRTQTRASRESLVRLCPEAGLELVLVGT